MPWHQPPLCDKEDLRIPWAEHASHTRDAVVTQSIYICPGLLPPEPVLLVAGDGQAGFGQPQTPTEEEEEEEECQG